MGEAATTHQVLLSPEQAAEWIGISRRQFDRLKGDIPAVPIGKSDKRYDPEDLRQWAADRKHRGSSASAKAPKRSKSDSSTPENDTVSPREQAILQRLQSKQRASTPRLYPVGEPVKTKRARPSE